jgi:hypothetical protein
MAQYLRDTDLPTLSITQARLTQINDILFSRQIALNGNLHFDEAIALPDYKSLSYTIRFDNKGYRFYTFNELIQHFNNASQIQRIVFILEDVSNRDNGLRVEVWLENGEGSRPRLIVTSDSNDWVDATFTTLESILTGFKSDYRWIRSKWIQPVIQIIAIVVFFIISFFVSKNISPLLSIDGAFYLTFFFTFLVFSNLWSVLNNLLFKFLDRLFPNTYFDREGKSTAEKWAQRSVNGAIIALGIYLISKLFEVLVLQLSNFIK